MVYIDSRMNQKIIAILVECASSEMHLNVEDSKIVASGRSGIIVKTTSRRSDCKGKAVCVKILFAERGTAQTEYLNGYRAHEALNTYKHSVKCPRHYCFYSVSARGLIGYHVILMDHIDHAVPLLTTLENARGSCSNSNLNDHLYSILLQLVKATDYLWARGIVHLAMHVANIMIQTNPDGRHVLFIIDWGHSATFAPFIEPTWTNAAIVFSYTGGMVSFNSLWLRAWQSLMKLILTGQESVGGRDWLSMIRSRSNWRIDPAYRFTAPMERWLQTDISHFIREEGKNFP